MPSDETRRDGGSRARTRVQTCLLRKTRHANKTNNGGVGGSAPSVAGSGPEKRRDDRTGHPRNNSRVSGRGRTMSS
jgi:hypothetical protein